MAVIAGVTETLGGLGLILGLLTPLAAAAVVGVMINAIDASGPARCSACRASSSSP